MKKLLLLLLLIAPLMGCSNSKSGGSGSTPFDTREAVLTFLKKCAHEGNILFGKHNDLTRGMGEDNRIWTYDIQSDREELTRSDTYRITGQFPAVLGMDVYEPLDRGRKGEIRSMIDGIKIFAGKMNGLVTLSYHMANPYWYAEGKRGDTYRYVSTDSIHRNAVKEILEVDGPVELYPGVTVKQFYDMKLNQAIDIMLAMTFENGKQIPLMVRLFHEASCPWFWWGTGYCTNEESIALYRYTADRMKEKCDNLIFIYGPDRNWDTMNADDKFMDRYPGDAYVDIIGYDDYHINSDTSLASAINRLRLLSDYAKKHDKVAVLAESGRMGGLGLTPNWFTDYLYKATTAEGVSISYILLWHSWSSRNDSGVMFPYKNDSPEADNVRTFISKERIKMNDFMQMQ